MSTSHIAPDSVDDGIGINSRIHGLLFNRKVMKKSLGEVLGLSHAAVSRKLNGHVDWKLGELVVLAETLSTSVAYLIGEIDDDAPLRKTKKPLTPQSEGLNVGPEGLEPPTLSV